MTINEQVLTRRLLEKISLNPEYAAVLGLKVSYPDTTAQNDMNLGGTNMVRQVRSDCTVRTFEKTRGLPSGTIRNPDGRDTRGDKKIGTIRKEAEKRNK